ncbi:MAG TPA: hypothetical protein VFI40_04845 [Nocardioides sp.]|nr:hypothetical protein [Nocardioides sp.]
MSGFVPLPDPSTRLPYLAGFFDGEGSIHIGRRGGLQVNCAQRDMVPLQLLAVRFGGRVMTQARGNKNPVSYWVIYGAAAARALEALKPYLIVKRAQAEVAITYQKTVGPRGYNRPLAPDVYALRAALRAEMDVLHA